jgi:hypothetical protein
VVRPSRCRQSVIPGIVDNGHGDERYSDIVSGALYSQTQLLGVTIGMG